MNQDNKNEERTVFICLLIATFVAIYYWYKSSGAVGVFIGITTLLSSLFLILLYIKLRKNKKISRYFYRMGMIVTGLGMVTTVIYPISIMVLLLIPWQPLQEFGNLISADIYFQTVYITCLTSITLGVVIVGMFDET